MANHPDAFDFMSIFAVECKHHKDIGLDKYLLDPFRKTFLAKTFDHTAEQARRLGLYPMVIAKSNHYPAVVILDYIIGMVAVSCNDELHYHIVHNKQYVLTTLSSLTTMVEPKLFLAKIKLLQRRRIAS